MSILHVPHYSQADSHNSLLTNIAGALRNVAYALFAAQPAAKPVPAKAVAMKKADREGLFRLARSYEDVSPNLAAELRYFGRQ
ncbi:hypothetical protein EDC30_10779 [Paucimonas lemoignei]|uniref:Uncharacterized protein n=1 Tax=Paucimonas lemoignei TaxID=29443 RepID=A0A4R3HT94_PAULE|nr:hypothetical protein [Paucimonas lemoignei]TCS36262.1 hypothetical protein EDC30_10779 [Paucimonas lemoignei]